MNIVFPVLFVVGLILTALALLSMWAGRPNSPANRLEAQSFRDEANSSQDEWTSAQYNIYAMEAQERGHFYPLWVTVTALVVGIGLMTPAVIKWLS